MQKQTKKTAPTQTSVSQANENAQLSRKDVQQMVTDFVIRRLEEGVIPWQMPYQGYCVPQNYVSKRPYRGINTLLLASLNYENPYFLTFDQVKELGGKVKKGEKGIPVVFWKMLESNKDTHINRQGEEVADKKPMLKHYHVFNVAQTENIEYNFPKPIEFKESDTIIAGENIYLNMPQKPRLETSTRVQAFYSPTGDYLHMPSKQYFTSNHDYYATLFHELVHSTGHKSRLDWEELEGMSFFGDENYSKEELTAEIGAAFLCAEIKIDTLNVLNSSASYIQSWLRKLKDDKTLILKASSKAQKAVDFILGVSYETKPVNANKMQPIVGDEQEVPFVSEEVGDDLPF
ncbi:zincin-like metallopeptidase domain-containing protein [Arcicella sp. LKC2W]|uniref:ArdC family protein n=1 Tax=Arcicella sp. LKC2W TaxID=2984198 RepID=UPI002B2158CC|nr:zincin-like metallopeptidase domain-containing protein [Arcicella sp. LKC2W]MEA5462017.1 zincin-like metallopeptidase domain-containing protein [Arcicella sp. LKC2W]